MNERKYEVEVKKVYGACESDIFKKMAKNGDITASKVTEMIGEVVEILGYAMCHITTAEREFDLNYYATNKGFISSGSDVLLKSVACYIDDIKTFKIMSIKTKKGTTYKVSPVLEQETE